MKTILVLALLAPPQAPETQELLVVYGGIEPTRLDEAVRNLGAWRFSSTRILDAESATREDVSRGALALVGTLASNRWLRELSSMLPLHLDELDGLDDLGDSIVLRSRNPLNPEAPLFVVTGNSNEAVLDALLKRRRADVHVRRNGKTLVLMTLDPRAVRRFPLSTKPALSTERFDYFVHGTGETRLESFAEANEALVKRIAALFPPRPGRLEVHLYESLEEKGLITDDTRTAHLEGDALHAVLGLDRTPERLLAERLLDVSDVSNVSDRRGLAMVLVTDELAELDKLDRTAQRLFLTSDPPALDSLDGESSYVVEALSASFARFVLSTRGPEAFRSRELDSLENPWKESLARKAFSASSVPSPPGSFQHGFTYSHEGYNIDNGYLSARAEHSLQKLSGLGIDAVAIVPYAFMRDPREIGPLSIPERPGSETDEDVTHAIAAAKAKGMTILLKPQIWIRRSWPGEIEPATPEDEERFFAEYGRWIRHYALMAERHDVEIFAIGTELSKMTGASQGRTARWKTLIGDIRRVYSGKLVYAANWGAEVEQVDFWPLLDYIGVDFYYPLSAEDAPSDEELRRNFEAALDRIQVISRRHDKPVLLTEIGYASTKSPWKSPHASDREREHSPEHQARVYQIAFEALEDETSWIRGMYWWKWPTDLANGGDDDRGFTPNGKAAEEVVRTWYRRRLQ